MERVGVGEGGLSVRLGEGMGWRRGDEEEEVGEQVPQSFYDATAVLS